MLELKSGSTTLLIGPPNASALGAAPSLANCTLSAGPGTVSVDQLSGDDHKVSPLEPFQVITAARSGIDVAIAAQASRMRKHLFGKGAKGPWEAGFNDAWGSGAAVE